MKPYDLRLTLLMCNSICRTDSRLITGVALLVSHDTDLFDLHASNTAGVTRTLCSGMPAKKQEQKLPSGCSSGMKKGAQTNFAYKTGVVADGLNGCVKLMVPSFPFAHHVVSVGEHERSGQYGRW